MQPTDYTQPEPKRHLLSKIVIGVTLPALIGVGVFFALRVSQQSSIESDVKTELIKQNKILRLTAQDKVYPNTLPSKIASTSKVIIAVSISSSGTTYCIEAKSLKDSKVIYHMTTTSSENEPLTGTCLDEVSVPPAAPSEVTISSTGAGVLGISWRETPFAASYTAVCATNSQFNSGVISKTTSSKTVIIENLVANTQYFCRVSASNKLGQSTWSKTVTGTPDAVSIRPSDLKVSTVSSTELSYSWTPVSGATEYILEYSEDQEFVKDVVTIKTAQTSGTAKNLKVYTGYYFHVKAITPQFSALDAAYSDMTLGRTAKK